MTGSLFVALLLLLPSGIAHAAYNSVGEESDTDGVATLAVGQQSGPAPLTDGVQLAVPICPPPGDTYTDSSISFGDSSNPGIATEYFVHSGDGCFDTIPSGINHDFEYPGTYDITFDVEGNNNNNFAADAYGNPSGIFDDVATVAVDVDAIQPPYASLLPSAVTGGAPLTVTFDGSASYDLDTESNGLVGGSGITGWNMSFGDGTDDLSDQNTASTAGTVPDDLVHTYQTPGTYSALLAVQASDQQSTVPVTIVVGQSHSAIVAAPETYKTGTSLTLNLSATLTRTDPNQAGPLAGKTLYFGADNRLVCIATTNSSGVAACGGTLPLTAGVPTGYVVTFTGDQDDIGASATGTEKLSAAATPADRTAVVARADGVSHDGSVLHGTASAGTRRVEVGLARAGRSLGTGMKLLRADGARTWTLKLGRRLRQGSYRLYVVAIDARGRSGRVTEMDLTVR